MTPAQTTYTYRSPEQIHAFIQAALAEDVGPGDYSTLSSVPATAKRAARLLVKSSGVLAGVELAQAIFAQVSSELKVEVHIQDGSRVQVGDVAFVVEGPAQAILTAERTVLNCMQRMSGIATKTRAMADMIAHTPCRLLDTRKTTPLFRLPEKWAVAIGGGENHRFGLFDMVMLKDNHIDYAGGVRAAIEASQNYLKEQGLHLDIVVETRSLAEVEEALATGGIRRLLLDNMDIPTLVQAVQRVNGQVETEASGGVTEKTLVAIAETGVDYISVGALTHSAGILDLSLKAM